MALNLDTRQQEDRLKRPRSDWLLRCTVLTNISLVVLLLLFEIQYRTGAQHFAWLPCILLLSSLMLASLLALPLAIVRVVRRKGKRHTVVLGILALAPIAFLSTVLVYASGSWQNRQLSPNPLLHIAKCLGASLMEADLALHYPQRVERRRFILFYQGSRNAEADANLMDAYLDQLERKYHRRIHQRIHWVHGALLGQEGLAIYGLAITGAGSTDEGNLSALSDSDRHEVAHAVMNQWMPPDIDPPTLLSEGWAEANARPEPLQAAYWYERNKAIDDFPARGSVLTTLTNLRYYHQDRGYVYPCGHALTLYLIDRYGPERYFKLYRSIDPYHVENTFKTVYGRDMHGIEEDMTGYLEALAAQGGEHLPDR